MPTVEINVGGKLVKIKEERGLLQRLILIFRSRPQLDLKERIGTYEFGVVPRSLFASDGTVLLAYHKAKILHHLELLVTYQAAKTTDQSKGPTNKLKKCIVTSGTETKGNICVPSSLVTNGQEEADTLRLLHALSIDRQRL